MIGKIRTVEELDDAIDAEIAWRKQELSTALQLISKSSGPAQRANLRAGIVILYAHWEGWVKTVAQMYVRYVHTKAYPYEKLSTAFLGHALKHRLNILDQTNKPAMHNEFAAFLRSELTERAALSIDLVRTESNLSSGVFADIIEALGLPKREIYESRKQMIDLELVHQRNTIAHGEFLSLTVDEYKLLRERVLELLGLYTDDVRNAAATGRHLATPTLPTS